MPIKISNNASSRLASTLSTTDTSVSVRPGDGVLFPSLSAGDWFPVTIVRADGVREICRCTDRSGDSLTIERAQEGTAAAAFGVGDRIELRLTEASLLQLVRDETANKVDITSPIAAWVGKAIGEPFPIFDHITGVSVPPTDNPNFRFVKLSADDSYNDGALTGEIISGSAPNITATAVVSFPGSPIDGHTIRLLNTERRFVGAGQSGLVEDGAVLAHGHTGTATSAGAHGHSGAANHGGGHGHPVNDPGHSHTLQTLGNDWSGDGGDYETPSGTRRPKERTDHSWTGISITGGGEHSHSLTINSGGAHTHPVTINASGADENLVKNQRASFYLRIF